MPRGDGLTARQGRFVAALLLSDSIKQAAEAAGIGERTARRYLCNPAVKEEIRRRQEAAITISVAALSELGQDAIGAVRQALAVLSDHAAADVADFMTVDDDGCWKLALEKAAQDGRLHLVKKLWRDANGERLELHDPQAAAVRLASVALDILAERRKVAELDDLAERVAELERQAAAK